VASAGTRDDERILLLTGQVDLGPGSKLDALAAAMAASDVPLDELDPSGIVARFPELRPRPGERALFHAEAGTVLAETAMRALLREAEEAGAGLAQPEAAVRLVATEGGAGVETDRGRTIHAPTVVVAAGPWLGALLQGVGFQLPLAPAIAQVTFVSLKTLDDRPGIVDWEVDEHGVGVPGVGYKVAFDAGSADPWDPDTEAWAPDPDEARALARWVAERLPAASAHLARHQRHPWTMTPTAIS
jgi:sarcosine oxidase